MKFSRESRYGLEALLFLAERPPGEIATVPRIARASGLPASFLAKIFQKLVQHGVLRSFRGATRGYALARSPAEISLEAILNAIEGPARLERCVFWGATCGQGNPCPLHERWAAVKPGIVGLLQETTLRDLARGRATPGAGGTGARAVPGVSSPGGMRLRTAH